MRDNLNRLVNAIQNNKRIEADEVFQYEITNKALEKLDAFKRQVASSFFNKPKES